MENNKLAEFMLPLQAAAPVGFSGKLQCYTIGFCFRSYNT